MDEKTVLEMMKFIRGLTLNSLKDLSEEQLTTVPEGLNNNILWNVGHVLFYQYFFLHGQCGQPIPLPDQYKEWFKGGSSQDDWEGRPDSQEVIGHLSNANDVLDADHAAGKLDVFEPMELFAGKKLTSLSESAMFHVAHEGMHMGRVSAIKKLLGI